MLDNRTIPSTLGRRDDASTDDDASGVTCSVADGVDLVADALRAQLRSVRDGRTLAELVASVAIERALAGDLAFWRIVARRTMPRHHSDRRHRVPKRVRMLVALALAVRDLMRDRIRWEGTSAQLLCSVTPGHAPSGWPTEPRGFSVALRRVAPDLLRSGIVVHPPERGGGRTPDRRRARMWRLVAVDIGTGEPPTQADIDRLVREVVSRT